MLYHIILLSIFGSVCFAKSIHSKDPHNFVTQGEDPNREVEEQDEDTKNYLNHGYYNVEYGQLTRWSQKDIYATGNTSKMTKYDDPPPFEVISIVEHEWTFPFYGHGHKTINIDSNGFVSMVPRLCPHYGFCNWAEREGNGESQYQRYIAPLMTDLNPARFNNADKYENASKVSYAFSKSPDNVRSLTVQWTNVVLFSFHDPKVNVSHDGFTFQAVLNEKGDITFNYKKMPYYPGNRTLKDSSNGAARPKKYPVVMGIEDAVIIKNPKKKSSNDGQPENILADYKPLNLEPNKIFELMAQAPSEGGVTVKFTAHPTCSTFNTCQSCVNLTNLVSKEGIRCGWCQQPKIGNVCADILGRETSSMSAGCLASKRALKDLDGCNNIGKDNSKKTWVATHSAAILVIIITLAVCLLGCAIVSARYKSKLNAYQKVDDDKMKGPGSKSGNSSDDNKVEMSA